MRHFLGSNVDSFDLNNLLLESLNICFCDKIAVLFKVFVITFQEVTDLYLYFSLTFDRSAFVVFVTALTNTNYDLLVPCVACEQRPLVCHEKQRPLVSPRKKFMCPYDKSAIIVEICFFFNFSKNLRSRL